MPANEYDVIIWRTHLTLERLQLDILVLALGAPAAKSLLELLDLGRQQLLWASGLRELASQPLVLVAQVLD